MDTLQSRLGSFSLLKKHYKKVKSSVQKKRRKRNNDPSYVLNITEGDVLKLSEQILDGTYKFSKLTPLEIEKPHKPGTYRGLLIPEPKDRIVHRAMLEVLLPHYEIYINEAPSYGVLKGRGVQKVFNDLKMELPRWKYEYVLIADIQKFFNRIDKKKLEIEISRFLDDSSLNNLVRSLLQAQFKSNPKDLSLFPDENNGIPQGCSLSPLFSDVFLKRFDIQMKKSGYKVIRYIDDFMILCKSKNEMYNGYRKARKILKSMGLNLDLYKRDKCQALSFGEKPSFLGVQIDADFHFVPSPQKFNGFKQKLGNNLLRLGNIKIRDKALENLTGMIEGWVGAYKMCSKESLDKCYKEINTGILNALSRILKQGSITQYEFGKFKRVLMI